MWQLQQAEANYSGKQLKNALTLSGGKAGWLANTAGAEAVAVSAAAAAIVDAEHCWTRASEPCASSEEASLGQTTVAKQALADGAAAAAAAALLAPTLVPLFVPLLALLLEPVMTSIVGKCRNTSSEDYRRLYTRT